MTCLMGEVHIFNKEFAQFCSLKEDVFFERKLAKENNYCCALKSIETLFFFFFFFVMKQTNIDKKKSSKDRKSFQKRGDKPTDCTHIIRMQFFFGYIFVFLLFFFKVSTHHYVKKREKNPALYKTLTPF